MQIQATFNIKFDSIDPVLLLSNAQAGAIAGLDLAMLEEEDSSDDLHKFTGDKDGKLRLSLSLLRWAVCLLRTIKAKDVSANPPSFRFIQGSPYTPAEGLKPFSPEPIIPELDFLPDDYFRALVACRWQARSVGRKKADARGPAVRLTNGVATLPIYIHPQQQVFNTSRTQGLQDLAGQAFQNDPDPMLLHAEFSQNRDNVDTHQAFDNAYKQMSGFSSLLGPVDTLDDERRVQVLSHFGESLEIMWDGTKHTTPAPSLNLSKPADYEKGADENDPERQKQTDRADVDLLMPQKERLKADHDFRQLQQSMNQRSSSKGQPFDKAAKDLGLAASVCEPSAETEGLPYYFDYLGFTIKFWQIISVDWMVKMCLSPLMGAICGDDVGLGKTIATILAILRLGVLRQMAIDIWFRGEIQKSTPIGTRFQKEFYANWRRNLVL